MEVPHPQVMHQMAPGQMPSAQMPPPMPHFVHPQMQQQHQPPEDQSTTQVIAGPDIGRLLQQHPQPLERKGSVSAAVCPKFKWALYAFLAGVVSGIFMYFMMTRRAAMLESMKKVGDGATKTLENVVPVVPTTTTT